jgi:hypothetical protein
MGRTGRGGGKGSEVQEEVEGSMLQSGEELGSTGPIRQWPALGLGLRQGVAAVGWQTGPQIAPLLSTSCSL